MLIVLGVVNLRGIVPATGIPPQPPDASTSVGRSNSVGRWLDRHGGGLAAGQLLRPLLVGVVHGLAGSAAVSLLVMAAIESPAWSMVYLLVFGVGTVVGMALITATLAQPFVAGSHRPRLAESLRVVTGLASVGFGCLLAYRVAIVQGLFLGGGP